MLLWCYFLSCSMLKRRAMTVRHDSVVRLLRDFFHHAGALVHIEPRIYETKRFRPDLDILLADTNIMIDVGITNPCAPSRTSTTALAAATTMEKAKVVEYKKFAEERGAKFFPFIIETLGAYGKETAKVLKVLVKAVFNSNIDSPSDYLVQCNRVVAVAVQRGNAGGAPGAVLSRAAAARSAYAELVTGAALWCGAPTRSGVQTPALAVALAILVVVVPEIQCQRYGY